MMEIRPGKTAPCELVNVAGEVITEGTHNHCLKIKRLIERCSKCGEEYA